MTPQNGPFPPNLYGMDRQELAAVLHGMDAPGFHAGQIFRWLYSRRRLDPREWTDLPRRLRSALLSQARVEPPRPASRTEADDGTVKYRVELPAGGAVEAVCMADRGRLTLCLSSQVGCALDCGFCLTGRMGLLRNLTPGEIAGQVACMQEDRDLGAAPFNVVLMGMGEPLHNYDGVLASFRLLTDPEGFGLSRRRITLSTAGLAPQIERLAGEPSRPRLAVSLNATDDALRDRLMPVNRRYPLRRLLEACRFWARTTGERFTFEYVLLAGVNDSDADMRRLGRIVRGLPAKLNLIPFNAVPGLLAYESPPRHRVISIRDRLLGEAVPVGVRWSRGARARAACGQLALLGEGVKS